MLCSTGSAVVSHLAVGFTYAKLVQDVTLRHEPKLSLQADLDFYDNMKLCMQLQSPEQLLTLVYTHLNYTISRSHIYILYIQTIQ